MIKKILTLFEIRLLLVIKSHPYGEFTVKTGKVEIYCYEMVRSR